MIVELPFCLLGLLCYCGAGMISVSDCYCTILSMATEYNSTIRSLFPLSFLSLPLLDCFMVKEKKWHSLALHYCKTTLLLNDKETGATDCH